MGLKVRFKKAAAFAVATLIVSGQTGLTVPIFQNEVYAADYTYHWAAPYLKNLLDLGIMRGDQDGNMDPDRNITRAEFVSMLNRAFGYNQYDSKTTYSDLDGTEWYATDIRIATKEGYFAGIEPNKAEPMGSLTREQAVSLICRNLKIPEVGGENFIFKDSRTFPEWSRGSINAATQKKIISGYEDSTFRPANSITRGEASKVFSDAVGELMSSPGVRSLGTVSGNVTISSSGVTIKDTVINGDLYITGGVGLGFTNFENVKVMGQVIISGAGEGNVGDSSIIFKDSAVGNLIIDGPEDKIISVKIDGTTNIGKTQVKSNAYLEELTDGDGGFSEVEQTGPEKAQLYLSGSFDKVTVKGAKNELTLGKGTINELVVDEEAPESIVYLDEDTFVNNAYLDIGTEIKGEGDIGVANITSNDVKIEGLPDQIIIRPGLTANINGQDMTSKDGETSSSDPRIDGNYPKVEEITSTGGNALFKVNKPGTIYWAVTLREDDGLKTDDLLKPKNVKEIIKSGTLVAKDTEEFKTSLSGLKDNKDYTLTAILVDEKDDESSKKKVRFTTSDTTKPNFTSGYPKVTKSDNTSAEITVISTKDCSLYWGLYPKDSVAPTAEELKKQKLDGQLKKGTEKNVKKNKESVIKVSGLKEATNYDFYIMASDGDNDSNVIKLSFLTVDKTPPAFKAGYPRADKTTDKSVDVLYNINEDGTVYYVVSKRGAVFPAPIPPATTSPSLSSEEAKQAVITGNNSFKNGNGAAKIDIEGKLTISGLEPETSYDLYMVAVDKFKNATDVKTLVIKTTDTIPPTAKQEFEEQIDGAPLVESDIRVVFSEEVWDATTLKTFTTDTLMNNITLYDLSSAKRTAVPVDYSKAVIENKDGKTIVTFSKEATMLNSGNKYEFELNKITDTSNNRMEEKTLLPAFTTVAPLVELVKTVAPENMDMTFELNPQAIQTADHVLFDIIFESSATIEFKLYEKDSNGVYNELSNSNVYLPFLMENQAMTLHYILDKRIYANKDYIFEPFNKLKVREYGIRITKVDGNEDRESWSKTIKMKIQCVIGSKTNLSIVAGDPIKGLPIALNEGATLVNYPKNFELLTSFTDTVVPSFLQGYPALEDGTGEPGKPSQVGDILIRPLVKTDVRGTFYYLVAPYGKVTNPNALDIMSGALKPQDSVTGKFEVLSGNTEFEVPITGLTPNRDYQMFCFLKGTPPETSEIQIINFSTRDVSAPIFKEIRVSGRGDSMAEISVTVDKDADIDWIVFPSKNQPATIIAEIIRNGAETTAYKPVAYSSIRATVKKGESSATVTIPVDRLERNIYYSFYAVAKSPVGGGDSLIGQLNDITPADVSAPTVQITTIISNPKPTDEGQAYTGTINLVFSEPIYYMEKENGDLKVLTLDAFKKGLKPLVGSGSVGVSDPSVPASFSIVSYNAFANVGGESPLSSVQISFSGILHNSTITHNYWFADANGNVSGKIYLVFVDNEGAGGSNRGKSEWTFSWDKQS